AASPPARWALEQLQQALTARGAAVLQCERISEAPTGGTCIVAAGGAAPLARDALAASPLPLPGVSQGPVLAPARAGERPVPLACGSDVHGLSYALMELADRVTHTPDPRPALAVERPIVERPANAVRSAMRLFVSEVEDKPWFYDRGFWER